MCVLVFDYMNIFLFDHVVLLCPYPSLFNLFSFYNYNLYFLLEINVITSSIIIILIYVYRFSFYVVV